MDISKESLNSLRVKLEKDYSKIEKEIVKLYAKDKDNTDLENKIFLQTMIDEQLDYIDNIISYLDKIPRMYGKLVKINERYNQSVGV